MAYLVVKHHQNLKTYALVDLSADEFEVVGRALRELAGQYERWGDAAGKHKAETEALIAVLERRYDDD